MAEPLETLADHTLWVSAIDGRGALATPALDQTERLYNGPRRVISLEQAAFHVGQLIAPQYFSAGQIMDEDPELEVGKEDFLNAHPRAINRGLYVPEDETWDSVAGRNRKVVVVRNQTPDIYPAGTLAPGNGVVFHPGDQKRIALSASYMAKAVQWRTEEAREPGVNSEDRDDIEQTILRSGGHTMESRIESIWNFDAELLDEYELFYRVFMSTRLSPPVRYRPETVSTLMGMAEDKIHRIAETSRHRRGLTNAEVQGMHRAITSNLYRRGPARQLAHHWRAYAVMGARYANTRMGKIHQSRRACEVELTQYQAALDAKAVA